tara:strand:- start:114 stop:899 length:786 start_codon:yes stop_codon:yes gene_type:complete
MLNINFNKTNTNIYWERQRGNNCRIHSLNAYFGHQKISDDDFNTLCSEYDQLIYGLKSINMDGFAECRSIISYVVDKYSNKYCQLIPINIRGIHNKNREEWKYTRYINFFGKETGIVSYFEFNRDHVWFNKKVNGDWYKIDSLSGLTKINKLRHFGDNGYLLVFEKDIIFYEIEYLITLIKEKSDDKLFEFEIAFNNLYHLLKRVKLNYVESDIKYNEKVSYLKTIYKILKQYITENRKSRFKVDVIQKLKKELNNIINIF